MKLIVTKQTTMPLMNRTMIRRQMKDNKKTTMECTMTKMNRSQTKRMMGLRMLVRLNRILE